MNKSPRVRVWRLRKELLILYYAFRDSRTPLYAKLPAIGGVLYLISPIDIIPDFIPFIGYLDDIVIVPLLINLSIRLLSKNIYEESLTKANLSHRKLLFAFYIVLALVICLLIRLSFKIYA